MQVADLRQRLIAKVTEASATQDEEATARVLAYVRAVLVALTTHPADGELDLQELSVGTRTAALILGLHPEYVRSLIRNKALSATKQNGEFSIRLSDVVGLMESTTRVKQVHTTRLVGEYLDLTEGQRRLWKRPGEGPEPEEKSE